MNLNGDGLVTPEELHAAGAPDEIVESVFALADADNGGNISLGNSGGSGSIDSGSSLGHGGGSRHNGNSSSHDYREGNNDSFK